MYHFSGKNKNLEQVKKALVCFIMRYLMDIEVAIDRSSSIEEHHNNLSPKSFISKLRDTLLLSSSFQVNSLYFTFLPSLRHVNKQITSTSKHFIKGRHRGSNPWFNRNYTWINFLKLSSYLFSYWSSRRKMSLFEISNFSSRILAQFNSSIDHAVLLFSVYIQQL